MSAPLQSSSANINNSAVFESASGSPALGTETSGPTTEFLNNENSPESVLNSNGASPLSNSGEFNTAAVPAPIAAPPPPPPQPSPTIPPPPIPVPAGLPAPLAASVKRRSEKQQKADEDAKGFRAKVNEEYMEMFLNIPASHRPKGFPAWAARQAIQLNPENQNAFVKSIADERRNAIEVKLGRKTRRVNSSTLKDIESILKMAEKTLIADEPRSKALIRKFGRVTRKVAREYTSENIATLETPSRARSTRRVNARLARPPAVARNRVNVSPPAYNE